MFNYAEVFDELAHLRVIEPWQTQLLKTCRQHVLCLNLIIPGIEPESSFWRETRCSSTNQIQFYSVFTGIEMLLRNESPKI